MPKLSFAKEIAEMESMLATVRSNADTFPPLALAVADELAARVAEAREMKRRHEDLLARRIQAT